MARAKACKSCFICILQEGRADVVEPHLPVIGHANGFCDVAAFALDVALLPEHRGGSARVEASTDFLPCSGGDIEVPAIAHLRTKARHVTGVHALGRVL